MYYFISFILLYSTLGAGEEVGGYSNSSIEEERLHFLIYIRIYLFTIALS